MSNCPKGRWSTAQQHDGIVALTFGPDNAQFGAVHTDSSYLRFVSSRASGWGTSLVLAPAFWLDGTYHHATPIAVAFTIEGEGEQLQMAFCGSIAGLPFDGVLSVGAPTAQGLEATVEITVARRFATDDRPCESFKLAMLSSMHVSETLWDTPWALVGSDTVALPDKGWLLPAPARRRKFGLAGGDSQWKPRAPTVTVELIDELEALVTGWVTASADPNDDNVGMWMAVSAMPQRWSYRIRITSPP